MAEATCYFCGAAVSVAAPACPQCRRQLIHRDRYRLLAVLGQGGFGVVYLADDLLLDRRCAIKVVTAVSQADLRLVESEADILSHHASRLAFIPDIYDIWDDGGQMFIVMEYVEGPTLDQLADLPWPPARVRAFLETLLAYLDQLHAAGIVHRDLKPENIKLAPLGRYVLLDFGIAKQGAATMTLAKALSPAYAPPEQVRGQPTDARSDLYSLAATAYFLLAGEPPPNAAARLAGVQLAIPPDGSPALQAVLLRMLDPDPAVRPASAREALLMLDQQPAAVTARMDSPRVAVPSSAGVATRRVESRPERRQLTFPAIMLAALTAFVAAGLLAWWNVRSTLPLSSEQVVVYPPTATATAPSVSDMGVISLNAPIVTPTMTPARPTSSTGSEAWTPESLLLSPTMTPARPASSTAPIAQSLNTPTVTPAMTPELRPFSSVPFDPELTPVPVQVSITEITRQEMEQLANGSCEDCIIYVETQPTNLVLELYYAGGEAWITSLPSNTIWRAIVLSPTRIDVKANFGYPIPNAIQIRGDSEFEIQPGKYYKISAVNG